MTVQLNIDSELDKEITSFINSNDEDKDKKNPKKLTFGDFLSDKMMIIKVIHLGIPYPLFDLIQKKSPFTENDWADFLDLSSKSLQRYKSSSKTFKPIHSEKIIEIAEVTHAGVDTFGNIEKFENWMNTPNFALGKIKPKELLKDSYGKEYLLGELTRINHGIFV